ncbi:hypothetical protein C9I94_04225 [Photobacterium swingsii]|uniref:Uncharacterized protein n=1 Tax=Photobacterium swingsii TaxID=680026 RepID=A0A2T3P9Z0_9GAMM|nr:DUF4344 domain-containing metallopeptidase [Photobacterium swingsii]PSW25787.1 hypothetical protein C9I94_04225 [Photobacterium swingsii]
MQSTRRLLKSLFFSVLLIPCIVTAETTVTFKAEDGTIPSDFLADIKQVSNEITLFFNWLAPINGDLKIVWANKIDGPLFDPGINTIQMPYEFATELYTLFSEDNYEKTGRSVDQATLDALQFILFHEYGHAYLNHNQIVVLGKEEDAVDNLATLLLLYFNDNGEDIVFSAADWFAISDEKTEAFEDGHFWDEHSLDAQRYYNIQCLVFGFNPEKYKNEYTDEQIEQGHDEYCESEHQRQLFKWLDVIAKHSHDITSEELLERIQQGQPLPAENK